MGYEPFIAFRYLRSPRAERSISIITAISVFGVAIGVMALIVVMSVMNGFATDLRAALMGANANLTIYMLNGRGMGMDDYPSVVEKVKNTIPVKGIAPFTMHQALLTAREKPRGTLVKGIDPKREGGITDIESHIRTETYLSKPKEINKEQLRRESTEILAKLLPHYAESTNSKGETRRVKVAGIIVGSQLANNIGVNIGDMVNLISPEERITPMGNMPRAKRFQVVGFFESGLAGYDEILSFIHIQEAQKIYKMGKNVTGLSVTIPKPEKADVLKAKLRKILYYPYIIKTWIEENRNLFAVIKLETLGLGVILALIILVAAFNIISSLIMLVIEKRKDIAILKSMGAQDSSIRKIFIIQGSIIGLMGTIIGEIGGILICYIIKNYDIIDIPAGVYVGNRIPMRMDFGELALIAAVSFFICFSVTIFPSWRASKTDPVKNIRYE